MLLVWKVPWPLCGAVLCYKKEDMLFKVKLCGIMLDNRLYDLVLLIYIFRMALSIFSFFSLMHLVFL